MFTSLEKKIISRILKPISPKTYLVEKLIPAGKLILTKILILAEILFPKELPLYLLNTWDITLNVILLKFNIENEVEFLNGIRIFLTSYTETFKTFVNKFLLLWINSRIVRIPEHK